MLGFSFKTSAFCHGRAPKSFCFSPETRARFWPPPLVVGLSIAFLPYGTLLAQEPRAEPPGDEPAFDGEMSVVVQGEPHHPNQPTAGHGVAGSVIQRHALEEPFLDAASALRREPGVSVVQYGGFGSVATASIRGATAEQTPVYLAGIRLNDEVGGAVDLSTIPLWLIDRVEIFRGNAPASVDQLGIGGAILFHPRRPEIRASGAGVGAGSFGARRGHAFATHGARGRSSLFGIEVSRSENDYQFHDDRGTLFAPDDDRVRRQRNADVSLLDAWLLNRFDLRGGSSIQVLANATRRDQGVPRFALLPSVRTRARFERVLAGLASEVPLSGDERAVVRTQSSFIATRSVFDDPAFEILLGTPYSEFVGQRANDRVEVDFEISERLRVVVAGDAAFDRIAREDQGAPLRGASAATFQSSLGADLEWKRRWFLTPMLSFSCRHSKGESLCQSSEPVGRLSLSRRKASFMPYAAVGRYVRLPTLGELFGAGLLVRGNHHLLPERGITAELGLRTTNTVGGVEVWTDSNLYQRTADRLVSYVRNAQGYLVPVNVREATVTGFETKLGARVTPRVSGTASLTWLDARDTTPGRSTTNDLLPFQSRLSGGMGGEVTVSERAPTGLIGSTKLRAYYQWQGDRFADPAGLIVIPAQSNLDLEVDQGLLSEGLVLRSRLSNVLDEERFDVVGYPLSGRSWFVSVEASL